MPTGSLYCVVGSLSKINEYTEARHLLWGLISRFTGDVEIYFGYDNDLLLSEKVS